MGQSLTTRDYTQICSRSHSPKRTRGWGDQGIKKKINMLSASQVVSRRTTSDFKSVSGRLDSVIKSNAEVQNVQVFTSRRFIYGVFPLSPCPLVPSSPSPLVLLFTTEVLLRSVPLLLFYPMLQQKNILDHIHSLIL